MTVDPSRKPASVPRAAFLAALAVVGLALAAAGWWLVRANEPIEGPTVGERLVALRAERAALEARAGGAARIDLLPAFRTAGLLLDGLAVRFDAERQDAYERLPPARRQAFADLDALNAALRDAVEQSAEGRRSAVDQIAAQAQSGLDRLASLREAPVLLSYSPGFVPPRMATGDLTLVPPDAASPGGTAAELDGRGKAQDPASPTVPRYAPGFAAAATPDAPVVVEVTGIRMVATGAPPPVLSVGTWRGEAEILPERLRFTVPRSAFPAEATRTAFTMAALTLRHGSRQATFQLLFTILPDRPGSFALDQRVRTSVSESNTLVSPEILARAAAGESRDVRRCFDPPAGWRFAKEKRRVVVVERLGWVDDIPDETMNAGGVEFARDEGPGQICLVVMARPATKTARTATIGRFEATLLRDQPVERTLKSGIRALDWREAVRLPLEPGMIEWKLYVRLFDETVREFSGRALGGAPPSGMPFLRLSIDNSNALVVQADPSAAP